MAAFPPLGWWPLGLLSLAVLFLGWRSASMARVAWRALLFGLGAYGLGLSWLYGIADHLEAAGGVSPLVVGLISAALLLVIAQLVAVALLYGVLRRGAGRAAGLLLFALCWTLFEWLRGWLFGGLPAMQLGYAVTATPLAALAPVGGVLAVTFVTALLAGVLALLPLTGGAGRLAWIGLAAALPGGAWGLQGFSWTRPAPRALAVRLVHGDMAQAERRERYRVLYNTRRYLALSEAAPRPDLILWPESSVAYSLGRVYGLIETRARRLREQGAALFLGAYVEGPQGPLDVLVDAADLRRYYAKRHLIPFAEYPPPLLDLRARLPSVAMTALASGAADQPLLQVAGIPFATTICFENLFGAEQRRAWGEAGFLVQVSDLAWFDGTRAAAQLLQVSQMRARESGKPLVQASNRGITAFIDARGRVRAERQGAKGRLDGDLVPRLGATPYARYGDLPMGLLLAGGLLLLIWRRGRGVGLEKGVREGAAGA